MIRGAMIVGLATIALTSGMLAIFSSSSTLLNSNTAVSPGRGLKIMQYSMPTRLTSYMGKCKC